MQTRLEKRLADTGMIEYKNDAYDSDEVVLWCFGAVVLWCFDALLHSHRLFLAPHMAMISTERYEIHCV